MLKYLLLVEVLRAQLKLLVLGFHGFAQFLKNLRGTHDHSTKERRLEGILQLLCSWKRQEK